MLAVQECYISVCKEKDMLEQREQSRGEEEEARIKEHEVRLEPNCGWIKDRWQCVHCTIISNACTACLCRKDSVFGSNPQKNMKEESAAALEKLSAELEAGHQVAVNQLKAAWSTDKEAEIKQRVESQVASEKAEWEKELRQVRLSPIPTLLRCGKDVLSRADTFLLPCRRGS